LGFPQNRKSFGSPLLMMKRHDLGVNLSRGIGLVAFSTGASISSHTNRFTGSGVGSGFGFCGSRSTIGSMGGDGSGGCFLLIALIAFIRSFKAFPARRPACLIRCNFPMTELRVTPNCFAISLPVRPFSHKSRISVLFSSRGIAVSLDWVAAVPISHHPLTPSTTLVGGILVHRR